ncbi:MAG: segregation and condensation protein B [Bermanella sp.]|jgi:segregation and condensation protein B
METEQLIRIFEGALLAAGKPLTVQNLGDLFEDAERPEKEQIREVLTQITESCEGRGFELREVASGFRFQVVADLAPWVGRLWEEKPQRYSRALLETLALIAYRQPITRGDIEDIRGVAVSTQIIKTLLEREWVRVVGHKDVPGRPAMYATTRQFLDYFNLKNLDDLPALADIKDLDTLTGQLGFTEADVVAAFGGAEVASQTETETETEVATETETDTEAETTIEIEPEIAAATDEDLNR